MTSRLAPAGRRSLPMLAALLGLAGWTASVHAAAPSPANTIAASGDTIVGPALPWQLVPALLTPALMPEAYYVTTGTTGTTGTTTTGTTTSVGTIAGKTGGGNNPTTPGGPGITIHTDPTPKGSPEPATLIISVIGMGCASVGLWRRRFRKDQTEVMAEGAAQA